MEFTEDEHVDDIKNDIKDKIEQNNTTVLKKYYFKCDKCGVNNFLDFSNEHEAINSSGFIHNNNGCNGIVKYIKELTDKENYDMSKIEILEEDYIENKKIHVENDDNEFIKTALELQRKIPLYYDEDGNLYVWKDVYWNRIEPKIVDIEIMNLLNDKLSYVNFFERGNKSKNIDAVKMIARKRIIKTVPKEWINTLSGVYNFSKKENNIFKATSDYFFAEPIPHKIGKTINTPLIDELFTQWIDIITRDDNGKIESIEHVKNNEKNLNEIAAYCLYDSYPIHTLFALHGGGRNGKGQYVTFLAKLLGGYNLVASSGMMKKSNVCSTTIEGLVESRFESAKLFRKKLCIIDETNFSLFKDTSIIKKLTGGSATPAEFKNGAHFEFFNTAKIIILTNSIPPTLDNTESYYARWFITDFPNRFEDGKDVVDDIPEEEYENFLFKCLQILPDILNKGFSGRGTMEDRKLKYENRANPFEKFKQEFCIEDMNTFESSKYLLSVFSQYCIKNKFKTPISVQQLNKQLENNYDINRKMYIHLKNGPTTMPVVNGLRLRKNSIQDDIEKARKSNGHK